MPPPGPGRPPQAEIMIDERLVRSLLEAQHPDLATMPIDLAAEGWDNFTFRLGDELAVRLPRRQAAALLIEHEQAWVPELAPRLPIPVPAPLRIGRRSAGYPWGWSVVPWLDGTQALVEPLHHSQTKRLGEFLRALHSIAPPSNPPENPYRGGPLAGRIGVLEKRLVSMTAALAGGADEARRILHRATRIPIDVPATWIHGDLHSKNVLSIEGRISAVIDWGDICTGDPATDLAALWILFGPENRATFWEEYGEVSEATVLRARAWAISFGTMLWSSHHGADPRFATAGLETIRRAAAAG